MPAARDAGPERFDDALAQGDRAFALRNEPARLEAALRAYRLAAEKKPGDPAAELRLARAEAFRALGAQAPAAAKEAWDASARAAEHALRRIAPAWAEAIDRGDDPAAAAARVDASGAEALYWLAQGAMRAAQATGYAAVLAVKDSALAMMARAAELDERVDAAGPHRALGAWRAALPVAAGGGAAAARAHFDRARALAPDDQLARVAEAETWAVLVQDEVRFEELLDGVLAFDLGRDPARAPENAIAKRRAKELLQRKARLF
ncbi:MAG TPA: TRAP transporter TatT component family protein [Anaeromyxobacter sp.]|nr:TRAP transporter TatT component family protein [Anaeromyxobacter sp.]